jgi:ubiquinone/menaquinone biosynthesis C-methylase UbiE
MRCNRILKWFVLILGFSLFLFFIGAKIASRIAGRWGKSAPCPASLSWVVDNSLRKRYMRPVLDWVSIQLGETVLELGPGPGVFTLEAAQRTGSDGKLIAVDIQPEMISQLKARLQAANLTNVETHVASAYELPLADQSVDRAFLVSVLPEIPNPPQALAELNRVLRPGGVLSITHEFIDPDYLFAGETISLVEPFGFKKTSQAGNWWLYTINFVKEG